MKEERGFPNRRGPLDPVSPHNRGTNNGISGSDDVDMGGDQKEEEAGDDQWQEQQWQEQQQWQQQQGYGEEGAGGGDAAADPSGEQEGEQDRQEEGVQKRTGGN